jgi:predicted nucleotidyltransferase
MKICGIIAEYNPFHNGHLHHIREAKALSGADYTVCVMSGNFTQRGEPAIFDKWIRAEAALAGGADIVAELPLLSALQSAEGFARGGVRLLNALGADCISFGSETADARLFYRAAELLAGESGDFKALLKQYLKSGESYPYARLKAAGDILGFTEEESRILCSPNAILALEYVKAIIETGSKMEPYIVSRKGSSYNETILEGALSSATAIRNALLSGGFSAEAAKALPAASLEVLKKHAESGFMPVSLADLGPYAVYALRKGGIPLLRSLYEISEGLEHRFYAAARRFDEAGSIIAAVKTKRYTYTRLSRILMYALLGITREDIASFNASDIPCVRILGVREESQAALSEICRRSKSPVLTSPGKWEREKLRFEALASDIYALTQKKAPYNRTGRDFKQKFLKV